jgi:hypothetical protein
MPTAGWSGYYQRQFGTAHSLLSKYTREEMSVSRELRTGIGSRKLRSVLLALTGATVGSASKTLSRKRVQSVQQLGRGAGESGGLRPIETQTLIAGNTTANDLSRMDTALMVRPRPASYPVNKSGWRPGNPGSLV